MLDTSFEEVEKNPAIENSRYSVSSKFFVFKVENLNSKEQLF